MGLSMLMIMTVTVILIVTMILTVTVAETVIFWEIASSVYNKKLLEIRLCFLI